MSGSSPRVRSPRGRWAALIKSLAAVAMARNSRSKRRFRRSRWTGRSYSRHRCATPPSDARPRRRCARVKHSMPPSSIRRGGRQHLLVHGLPAEGAREGRRRHRNGERGHGGGAARSRHALAATVARRMRAFRRRRWQAILRPSPRRATCCAATGSPECFPDPVRSASAHALDRGAPDRARRPAPFPSPCPARGW
jgi:hypothetical protein